MQTIDVKLTNNHYPIYIGKELLNNSEIFLQHISGKQVLIVTNETIAPLYLKFLQSTLASKQCDVIVLPDGEVHKTFVTLDKIFSELLSKKHTRNTTLIALGGGVIGDLTGFAAACYMRGVAYLQVPTTLLAQVDAAIGGKTAVNHPLGKNMLGAFYQPKAVIMDVKTLQTLPDREFYAGFAEVIKYGLLNGIDFFVWLEKNLTACLAKDPQVLETAIYHCAKIKADIVAADEKEQNIRAWLNLGHTFAHAIENALGYGVWYHGEAVGVGLLLAADLSVQLNKLNVEVVGRIKKLLLQAKLPVGLPEKLSVPQLLEIMQTDKKNIHGKYRLILLAEIGKPVITEEVPIDLIKATLVKYKD